MRTTLMLDDDIHAAAKQIARESGRTFGEVISRLVRRGLSTEPRFDRIDDLPVFPVGPSATAIPGTRAKEILDEEGS